MRVEIEKIVYLEHIHHSYKNIKKLRRNFKVSSEKGTITGPSWVLSKMEVRQEFTGFPGVRWIIAS